MYFFAIKNDFVIKDPKFSRRYIATEDIQKIALNSLYTLASNDYRNIKDERLEEYKKAHPDLSQEEIDKTPLKELGIYLTDEKSLLSFDIFPHRLGRSSTKFIDDKSIHKHTEPSPLRGQLAHLKTKNPNKKHFRIALINGFGANLGDALVGASAFRLVYEILQKSLGSVSCDILYGMQGYKTQFIWENAGCIERVLYAEISVEEFCHYDAYFDCSQFISEENYNKLPTFDWVLYFSGLDPKEFAPEQKRLSLQLLHTDISSAANSVATTNKNDKKQLKILFSPLASVTLRSIPVATYKRLMSELLGQNSDFTLIIDHPKVEFEPHPRIVFAEDILSANKFSALISLCDGVISVDSFALHLSDAFSVPCVALHSSTPKELYPYYPFYDGVELENMKELPAFRKPKVEEKEWENIKADYEAAWEKIDAKTIALKLRKMIEKRANSAATNAQKAVSYTPKFSPYIYAHQNPTMIVEGLDNDSLALRRMRLASEHAININRLLNTSQNILKSGSTAIIAGCPDARLASNILKRISGVEARLIIFEPRIPLNKLINAHLCKDAMSLNSFEIIDDALPIKNPKPEDPTTKAKIPKLDELSDFLSSSWGNCKETIDANLKPIDELGLKDLAALFIQNPMPLAGIIDGAKDTINRTRAAIFASAYDKGDIAALSKDINFLKYDAYVESVNDKYFLLMLPSELKANISGFTKVKFSQGETDEKQS